MLPSPRNGSDCICPVFGAKNKFTQCLEWLMLCNKLWAGALLKTDFELIVPQLYFWTTECSLCSVFVAACFVSIKVLHCCLWINFLKDKKTADIISVSIPSQTLISSLLSQRCLISNKSRLVQAWIFWSLIYRSFLPWMIFGIVLHCFVTLDILPLVRLTVPCSLDWLRSSKFPSVCALFSHCCCLLKDLSPMSMVVASSQKPHSGLMDYSSWKRWGMLQLLIHQPIQIAGFRHSHVQKPAWSFRKFGQC